MARWMYDVVLKVFAAMVDIFFREIQVRGAWRVPTNGPIILVAGPHANQVRIHLSCSSLSQTLINLALLVCGLGDSYADPQIPQSPYFMVNG